MEDPPISGDIRISLLLEEYRYLRDEQKQGMGERITLLSFVTAAAALVIAKHWVAWAIVGAIALLIVAAGVWYRTWRGLDKRAQHLEGLERRINKLALPADETQTVDPLLTWETKLCQGRRGMKGSPNPLKRMWGTVLYREIATDGGDSSASSSRASATSDEPAARTTGPLAERQPPAPGE